VIAREFWVIEGRQADFEKVFRPAGPWAELLGRSKQYLGTEFRLESQADRRYRVFDYWMSHWSFEDFRSRHQWEYERFSQEVVKALVQREMIAGSFYEGDSGADFDAGTDLVPSS
jgi:hypothetical protein